MHLLFILLGIIVSIVALVLILALIAPKSYAVRRDITINRPVAAVFDYIRLLRNQEVFSEWQHIDPHSKKNYTGTDGTPGFTMAWDSTNKKAGKGEQEIKRITPEEQVDYEIRFIAPFPGVADVFIKTEPAGSQATTASWGLSSKMSYPMNIMLLFMNMDKMLGKDLAASLVRLKNELEK